MKAIETRYKGYRFRSRLEARWAVFFDALEVPFEYEKEGFDLGEVGLYLPDFYIPNMDLWIEIKPKGYPLDNERLKCRTFAKDGNVIAIFDGDPTELILNTDSEFYVWSINEHEDEVTIKHFPGFGIPGFLRKEFFMMILSISKHLEMSNKVPAEGEIYKQVIKNACNSARAARFEHGEMP